MALLDEVMDFLDQHYLRYKIMKDNVFVCDGERSYRKCAVDCLYFYMNRPGRNRWIVQADGDVEEPNQAHLFDIIREDEALSVSFEEVY